VTLFHIDNRVEKNKERLNTAVMNFSNKEAAKRISDIVSAHFGLQEMWDKSLIGTFFMPLYIPTTCCELGVKNGPNLGIEIAGDSSLVYNVEPQDYKPVDRQNCTLLYRSVTKHGKSEYNLTYTDIVAGPDMSTVALYNSSSFKGFYQESLPMCLARYLEKTN